MTFSNLCMTDTRVLKYPCAQRYFYHAHAGSRVTCVKGEVGELHRRIVPDARLRGSTHREGIFLSLVVYIHI